MLWALYKRHYELEDAPKELSRAQVLVNDADCNVSYWASDVNRWKTDLEQYEAELSRVCSS